MQEGGRDVCENDGHWVNRHSGGKMILGVKETPWNFRLATDLVTTTMPIQLKKKGGIHFQETNMFEEASACTKHYIGVIRAGRGSSNQHPEGKKKKIL